MVRLIFYAEAMANIATSIGIKSSDIIIEPIPKDTKGETLLIKLILQKIKFILVTSLYSMGKAMGLFKKQGLDPISAPTNHLSHNNKGLNFTSLVLTSIKIEKGEATLHEYYLG